MKLMSWTMGRSAQRDVRRVLLAAQENLQRCAADATPKVFDGKFGGDLGTLAGGRGVGAANVVKHADTDGAVTDRGVGGESTG